MKKISKLDRVIRIYNIFFLLILLQTATNIFAQTPGANRWFVNKNATGLNNGTSWENGWISFTNINWNLIQPGSTVYISGGTDSTVYNETLTIGKSGTPGNFVTVTRGLSDGHNGRVVINHTNTNGISIDTKSYVRVEKLELRNMQRGIFVGYASNVVYIDSCKIYNYTNHGGIRVNGSGNVADSIFIRWNTVEENITFLEQQTDNIYVQEADNVFIEGNRLIQKNDATQGSIDNIQFYMVGNATVKNNFMENYSTRGSQCMILGVTGSTKRLLVMNNVAIHYGASSSSNGAICLIRDYYGTNFPYVQIYENTFIGAGHYATGIGLQMPTSVRNNLVYMRYSDGLGYRLGETNWTATHIDSIQNNLIYCGDGGTQSFYGVFTNGTNTITNPTWTQWTVTLGATGIQANPLFTDYNNKNFTLQSGSPAINAGKTLGSPYNVDILGVTRPHGAGYDIGAYEYTDGSTVIDIKEPALLGASVINPTTIELTFSEALENSSALVKTNYSINNGIVVNSVSLSTDSKKVTLNTTTNAANQTYTVTVSNVKDLAGNVISASNNSAQYSYAGDTTPPNLLSAAVINPTTIELTFSEALESNSASTKANYSINNGITVNNAVLSTDQKKVTLTTSQHIISQNYIVTVSNVKDLAGNSIAPNSSVQYSFINNTVGNLKANVKIYLEGPFQSNIMITELSGNELIPVTQPYKNAPWLYNGSEVINSIPSTAVDWILVELRSAQNPGQVISRRAALLRNDGRIIEPNGNLGVTFNNLLYGSYYIAVFHRNHLAVMTAVPVLFSPDNSLYDFTNALTKAYGQSAMTEMTTGIFGMYAGDGNGDGIVDDKDRNEVWSNQNGNLGYYNGDFNLDSGVTVKDINDYWNLNDGKVTQVP